MYEDKNLLNTYVFLFYAAGDFCIVSEKFMNEELKRWIRESKTKVKSIENNIDKVGKKPSGKCQICGERNAEYVFL